MEATYITECLNRVIGRCPDCKKDYDPKHFPNNYDCKYYREIKLLTFEVKENSNLIKILKGGKNING